MLAQRGVVAADVSDLREKAGYGVEGPVERQAGAAGAGSLGGGNARGRYGNLLQVGDASPLALTFTDRLRPGAARAVVRLQKAGLAVTLLSGDAETPVAALAGQLGIGQWQSDVLPAEKAAFVAALQDQGRVS